MTRPWWQAPAEAAYAVLLLTYPRGVRERHGEEMRQVFRDRCREAAEGRISAWRLLFLELAPDLATSVGHAHLAAPAAARTRVSLAALLALLGIWACQASFSPGLLDAYYALNLNWQHWRESRAMAADEARVRALAVGLESSPREYDRALAAYLHAVDFAGRGYATTYALGASRSLPFAPSRADGERASRVLASVPLASDAASARLALAACLPAAACDRLARAQALAQMEPRNAYAWSQLLKLHSQAGDEAMVRRDLHALAEAAYYEDGLVDAQRRLYALAVQDTPADAAMAGALGRQLARAEAMRTDDLADSLFIRCALQDPSSRPRWLQAHPEARSDCRAAATLFAHRAGAEWESAWGWRWLDRDASTAQSRAGVEASKTRLEQSRAVGITVLGERRWRAWSDAEWLAWMKAKAGAS